MGWQRSYRRAVIGSDFAVAAACTGIAVGAGVGAPTSAWLAPVTIAAFLIALSACRAWHPSVLGQGAEEFRRLGVGAFMTVVVLGLGCVGLGIESERLWIFCVVPAIGTIACPLRYLLRKLLHRARSHGRCLLPVLAAGGRETVADLITRTRELPHVGWRVAAVCTPTSDGSVNGVPVVGGLGELAEQIRRGGYRIVAVTADTYWTPQRLQRLAWEIEGTGAEMVVAPVLMDVAGPRLHMTGVLGLPLLRVSAPTFTGATRVVKGIVDRIGALLLLTLTAPLLLVIAVAVVTGDRGPVLYRQRRIGKDGVPFTMVKFRSMVVDADRLRDNLVSTASRANPMFKLRRDPRVTGVGAVLRRYSLDELPQLVNVLCGQMSLVGPRPPLPQETEQYGDDMRRRLLVKPGLTGLWQVSGRSELSWEETVRLDLRYVEDWSLALDAVILWKTVHAVIRGTGAY